MKHWSQERFLEAWNFAAAAHGGQKVPGSDWPYLNHIGSVAMEIMSAIARGGDVVTDPDLAVQCALLHDVIEDAGVTREELSERFGAAVANGVQALSKDKNLPSKKRQMLDSLRRIRAQPREVWMVKLADRISNLQTPPHCWTHEKIRGYREEAELIHEHLGEAHEVLADRLAMKIERYAEYLEEPHRG